MGTFHRRCWCPNQWRIVCTPVQSVHGAALVATSFCKREQETINGEAFGGHPIELCTLLCGAACGAAVVATDFFEREQETNYKEALTATPFRNRGQEIIYGTALISRPFCSCK
jgi:hypothetical protein